MKPPAKDRRLRERWVSPGRMKYATRPRSLTVEHDGEARQGQDFRVLELRGWVREGNQDAPRADWRTKNEAISESGRRGRRAMFVATVTICPPESVRKMPPLRIALLLAFAAGL